MASLGNRVGPGCNFENKALGHYTKALSATFGALKDPVLSKEDSTLAAVLLLGLFENITAKQLGMLAWGSHIEGAIHLVKSRDKKQIQTKQGLALFVATRTQMVFLLSQPFSCQESLSNTSTDYSHIDNRHTPSHGSGMVDYRQRQESLWSRVPTTQHPHSRAQS